jgi:hypothetical protein
VVTSPSGIGPGHRLEIDPGASTIQPRPSPKSCVRIDYRASAPAAFGLPRGKCPSSGPEAASGPPTPLTRFRSSCTARRRRTLPAGLVRVDRGPHL